MIKAVIFDMNGVIIDDEHVHELAFQETLKPFNIDLSHQDYLKCCAGKTDEEGYLSVVQQYNKPELPINELLKQKSLKYLKLFPANKRTYPGVLQLIKNVSHTFTLALTSSSSRSEVDLITNEFDLSNIFSITISANEVKKGKPDPEPYQVTCQKLGILPNEAVVIEDSRSGVESAIAAGCFCIGILTTHTYEDLKKSSIVVQSFDDINVQMIKSKFQL